MGVHVTQAAQAVGGSPESADVGQEDALVVAHHDVGNGTLTVDQYPDLTIDLLRQFTEVPAEFLGDDLVSRHLAAIDVFETPDLTRFQPRDVAVYALDCGSPLFGSSVLGRGGHAPEIWRRAVTNIVPHAQGGFASRRSVIEFGVSAPGTDLEHHAKMTCCARR